MPCGKNKIRKGFSLRMDESDIIRMHRKRIHTHRSRSLVDTRLLCDHFSQYPFYIWYSSLRIPSIKGTITFLSDFVNKKHLPAASPGPFI